MTYRARLILVLILLFYLDSNSQQGFFVPKQGKIYFAGDTATIFSTVTNQGTLGIDRKATINFKGQSWHNDQTSIIADETSNGTGVSGKGGVVRFMGDSGRQRLTGGYNVATSSGPVFANLQLFNPFGLELAESSAKVWQEMKFVAGRFYLNNQIFVVGSQDPGRITGYDSARYFVTGTQQGGGLLVRENIRSANGLVTFPVGTKDFSYTPAAIRSKSVRGDDYHITLFDGVKTGVTNGYSLGDSSVDKTWQIGKRYYPGKDEVEVFLQHLNTDEGAIFAQNRNRSYISQNINNRWEENFPQVFPAQGYLTSGAPLINSGVNSYVFKATISETAYFTKLTGSGKSTLKTKLLLGAHRVGAFVVDVRWQTKPEINVKKFVVERRRANETNFVSINTVASLAIGGYSEGYLNYSVNDSNSYKGISFYRLKVFDFNDSSYYSPIFGVRGVSFSVISLWPNPTPDKFNIILPGHVATYVVIQNGLGKLVWKEEVAGRNVMEVKGHHLIPGVYFVSILGNDGQILGTEKLVIVK